MNARTLVAASLLLTSNALGLAQPPAAPAPAWPQWGGPTRDFKAPSRGLTWPPSGPRQVWTRPLGEGYSSIVSDGVTLYTMYRPVKGLIATVLTRFSNTAGGHPEVVAALDAATGAIRWERVYDAPPLPRMNLEYGPGPHATPLIAGERVFAVGTTGKLHALDRGTGRVVWSHDLWGEYGGRVQGRGYSCSPIAYGDTVIVTVGGSGAALMAFRQADGSVAWKNGGFDPGPSSPLLIDVDGQQQLVVFHADGVAGTDPRSGTVLWNHPHQTDYGLNISTPVWGEGNVLFISSAYSGGSRGLHLSQSGGRTTVKELWFTPRMRVHFGSVVRVGDHVYGSSGDFGPAFLTAINVKTGQIAWQERGFARASVVLTDGKLLVLDEDGTLALATATPAGLTVHAKRDVLDSRAWTAPTVVGTRVYLRDRETIKALDLGGGGGTPGTASQSEV